MPDQHCPTCGTARSTGCGCVPDPSLTETAVLPHIEGPPLVRPYIPQTADQVADEGHPGVPTVDPFATTVLPPVAPGRPAGGPPVAPPLGPDADAYATTVLPPVPPVGPGQAPFGADADGYATALMPPVPPVPSTPSMPSAGPGGYPATAAQPQAMPQPQPQPQPHGNEIGVFPVSRPPGPAEGGRAARRAAERTPLAQRKGLLAGVGAALVALTIGVAYAVTPSTEPPAKQAQPLPTTTLAPAPVDPPTTAAPAPSAVAPTSEAPSPTATPTPTHKPSPTKTATPPPTTAPAPPPAAPAQPPAPAPTPTPPPPQPPAPAPSPRTLQMGDSGPDVRAMQQLLYTAECGFIDKSIVSGTFDGLTRSVLMSYQRENRIKGENGVYGPKTQAALTADPGC
ncbi:peptidoglycan-binding domain-containing protein [Kitasatospora brasiliensis]|uniref:peptidoglycan-binding domain-containing protein n=1 Tax=Kitasatospora brasiliensis TaxID=3058040 RepID=UPI00292ED8BD|nr:peptidoglycan-binding domain-containing protein [Kitasatospora sp. K002]